VKYSTEEKLRLVCIGYQAMKSIDTHVGSYFMGINAHPGHLGACKACMKYAAAMLRGVPRVDAIQLMCANMQEWLEDVSVAEEIISEEN